MIFGYHHFVYTFHPCICFDFGLSILPQPTINRHFLHFPVIQIDQYELFQLTLFAMVSLSYDQEMIPAYQLDLSNFFDSLWTLLREISLQIFDFNLLHGLGVPHKHFDFGRKLVDDVNMVPISRDV